MSILRTILSLKHSQKFWVLTDQVLVSGVSFITTILAARQLNILQFGWFASVLLVQLFILAMQNALIMGPYQVLQADYDLNRKRKYQDALFLLQIIFVVFLLLGGCVLFYIPFSWIQPLFPARWWILLAIGGYLLQDFLRRVLLAGGDAGYAFLIDALTNLLQLVILVLLFVSGRLNFVNCFEVIGLTFIPSILLGYLLIPIKTFSARQLFLTIRQHILHGKWLLLTALLQWWAGNIFIVAAGIILGVAAFGALRLAQNIFGIFNVLLQAVENYALPQSARLFKSSRALLKTYLRHISFRSALFFVPVLVLMALFSRQLFRLTGGEQYVSYYSIIPWLSLLYLFIFLGYPVRIAIRVLLLNRVFFIGYLASALFSCLAARHFIGWWGVYGVICGLIINQLLILSYWLFVLNRKNMLLWK